MRTFAAPGTRWVVSVVLGVSLFGLGVTADEPTIVTPAYNTLTDQQEVDLGREFAAELEKREGLRFITAPRVQAYVEGLVQRIAKASRRPTLPYSVKVVDSPVFNAFALPGGLLYVQRGLVEQVSTESELVGVLGHEINHVVGRHGANNFARYVSGSAILREMSNRTVGTAGPAAIAEAVGITVVKPLLLKYSREDELQADLLGYYNIQRAGWNPASMRTTFERLEKERPAAGGVDELLNILGSHPTPRERKAQVDKELAIAPPQADLLDDSAEFRAVKAELKTLARAAGAGR